MHDWLRGGESLAILLQGFAELCLASMADSPRDQIESSLDVADLAGLVRQQADTIAMLEAQLSAQIDCGLAAAKQQSEAQHLLQALLGDESVVLKDWPMLPDFGLLLVRLIRDNQYDLIVEFGGGASTWVCLRALELFAPLVPPGPADLARMVTFEHHKASYQRISDLVAVSSARGKLDLRLAELELWEDCSGAYSYYSGIDAIGGAIDAVRASVGRQAKLLVVINGPPADTCHWPYYPAVPVILDAASLKDIAVDFLLGDLLHGAEQEMVLAWERQFQNLGLICQCVDWTPETTRLLLKVDGFAGADTSISHCESLAQASLDQESMASALACVDALLADLEAAKQVAAKDLRRVQKARERQDQRVQALEAEIERLTCERAGLITAKSAAEACAADLQGQLAAQSQALHATQALVDAQASQLTSLEAELGTLTVLEAQLVQVRAEREAVVQQLEQQGETFQQSVQQLKVIPKLELELQLALQEVARLRFELESQSKSLQELELLRAECARRFQWFQLSEDRAITIAELERRCGELERERNDELLRSQQQFEQQGALVSSQGPAPQLVSLAAPGLQDRVCELEQELQEARGQTQLLLEQFLLVQEELERQREPPSPAAPPPASLSASSLPTSPHPALASPQQDAERINANRVRLLTAA